MDLKKGPGSVSRPFCCNPETGGGDPHRVYGLSGFVLTVIPDQVRAAEVVNQHASDKLVPWFNLLWLVALDYTA